MKKDKGPLIILSGPSGSGKSTIIKRLLAPGDLHLKLSVSATTRKPREGEREGRDYYFWPREQFEAEQKAGAFLEWAEVFGNYYGTLRKEVDPLREQGWGVLLDIDIQGAAQLRQKCPDAVAIFIRAASLETYEARLRKRGTESAEAIARRVEGARRELQLADEYNYQVLNDDLDAAVGELRAIVSQLL